MTAIKMCFKAMCLTMVLALLSGSAHAASFFEEAGDWYNKFTNPISWLLDKQFRGGNILNQIPIDHRLPGVKNESERLNYHVSMDYYSAFVNIKDFADAHENFLLNILTFGNDESQRNLNIAYRLSLYVNQYHFFAYTRDSWYYLPVHMDAGSIFMYGVSYVINIPQRVLTKIDLIWDINDYSYGLIHYSFGDKLIFMIDVVLSTLAQFIEFFFAVFGTMIGMVIAFICHPINSICSFVGIIYFAVPVLWSAIGGSLISLVSIFF